MLCRSLIASIQSFAFYAVTAMLTGVLLLAGSPRPLGSAVAARSSPGRARRSPSPTAAPDGALRNLGDGRQRGHGAVHRADLGLGENGERDHDLVWLGQQGPGVCEDPCQRPGPGDRDPGHPLVLYFPGDGKGHKAGEVWIDKADLQDVPWPRWARARRPTVLRSTPDLGADSVAELTRGNYVEIGETQGRWAKAFYLTDRQPGEWAMGWVDGLDLMLPRGDQVEMSSYLLTRASLLTATPDVWLTVPYRSQLDGSTYAEANCGPTSIAMALAALGKIDTLENLRSSALKLQDSIGCDDCGTYIQHLAMVAEARGARTYGLRDDADTFHHWTLDEVRQQIRQERVVIPQVQFRQLPGRTKSPYGGDHYIVLVGIEGTSFIYNDPVDSDGRGYGRLITADQLEKAMSNAHGEFSWAAFAVGK